MSEVRQGRLVILSVILFLVLLLPSLSHGAEAGGGLLDGDTGKLFLPPEQDSAEAGADEEETGDISHWLPLRSAEGSRTTSSGGINLAPYGFFETENNQYKEAQRKLRERDSSIRQALFLEGSPLKQPPKVDPAEMVRLWGFFEEPYEYTDGTYNVSYEKNHGNTLFLVLVFFGLAAISFFAALGYHRLKARRRH